MDSSTLKRPFLAAGLLGVVAVSYVASATLMRSSDAGLQATATESDDHSDTDFQEPVADAGLKLDFSSVDFGTVFEGMKLTQAIVLTNSAAWPIKMVGVNSSCGCTTVDTDGKFVLQPGEQRSITVQLNTTNNLGRLEKTVSLYAHERGSRFKFLITLKAVSLPLVLLDKDNVDLGMVPADQEGKADIQIRMMRQPEAAKSEPTVRFLTVPENVKAELTEVPPTEGAVKQWQMTVTVRGSDIPEESVNADIVIMTPSTAEAVMRIPVRAHQHSWVSCEPSRISFGALREGAVTSTVRLSCEPGQTFEVMDVQFHQNNAGLTASYDQKTSSVSVTAAGSDTAGGFFQDSLRIHYTCNAGPRQTLIVPVTGYRMR
ncbi:MAG: DUF1573 domain-containing protein [Planctomycetaceae bacterium]